MSAPAGSGKTVLLRSWIGEARLAEHAAWVAVERDERDPQRLWLAVLDALRQTIPGSALVRELTTAPDLDGWTIVERLLKDLAPLADRLWLVIDDLHELGSAEALRQLELLVMRSPEELRLMLATRHDVRLGLHRLRLKGELTEFRADDLRFSVDEARALFAAAGVALAGPALGMLHERTEGWAAGLRLAALSLAGHPDPGRFAAEFCGTERTVAEYLLAEVLERQPEEVRRLLLRTSGLDRVNGELADLLTGASGGERVLQDLEEANAFVVSLDAARSWFRYHHLFAELLQLELRRTQPEEVTALHELAAGWLAGHGYPVEAIRHAQAAQDWGLAAGLLADHWPALYLGRQEATVHALMAGFPDQASAADGELAAVAAADELAGGSLGAAQRYLGVAERGLASVPESRRGQAQVLLGVVRLLLARQHGNLSAAAEQAQRLQALAEAPDAVQPGLGDELRAFALVKIGDIETWAGRLDQAEFHLDQGVALARRIGRSYLEFMGLVDQAEIELNRPFFARAAELSRQAIDLAERHGWTDDPAACTAYMTLGAALAWQGRLDEAEAWVQRAERTMRAEATPRWRWGAITSAASSSWAAAGPPTRWPRSGPPSGWPAPTRSPSRCGPGLCTPWRGSARPTMPSRSWPASATATAGRYASPPRRCGSPGKSPHAATAALAPVLAGSARVGWRSWLVEAFLLEAIARDALGDPDAAGRAVERALDHGRARRRALVVPDASCPGPAQVPHAASHRAWRPDRPDPRPAGREQARAARRAAADARAAQQERDPRAALPADPHDGAGDRQ